MTKKRREIILNGIIEYFGIEEDANIWDVGDIDFLNECLGMKYNSEEYLSKISDTFDKYGDLDSAIEANLPKGWGDNF